MAGAQAARFFQSMSNRLENAQTEMIAFLPETCGQVENEE
jgi:hypothetical protein